MRQREDKRGGKIRLKDISGRLGVSAVSVHRALSGKSGVSESLREKVIRTADEMGYIRNYAAASMKKGISRIGIVLPRDHGTLNLYFNYLWLGISDSAEELRYLNIETERLICEDEREQERILEKLLHSESGEYAGLITFFFTRNERIFDLVRRISGTGVSVLVIDDDPEELSDVSCIPSNETISGAVAADFVSLVAAENSSVLLSSGRLDSAVHERKRESFIAALRERRPDLREEIIEGYSRERESNVPLCENMAKRLREKGEVSAVYALTSHDNRAIVEAIEKSGRRRQIRLLGTDLNEESILLLRQGRMDAVIDQAAYQKGYRAFQLISDQIMKCLPGRRCSPQPIDIVMKANLDFHTPWRLREQEDIGGRMLRRE